jgi:hypothetical protein
LKKGFVFQRLIIAIYLRIKQKYLTEEEKKREKKRRRSLLCLFPPARLDVI